MSRKRIATVAIEDMGVYGDVIPVEVVRHDDLVIAME